MKFVNKLSALMASVVLASVSIANASPVLVDAQLNSASDGNPANSGIQLYVNQTFTVTVDPSATWNFGGGDPSYEVTADGMGGVWDLAVTNPDGSTFHATIGALVGQIGSGASAGNFFTIGTNFSGTANAIGELNLFFWDSDSVNNSGAVVADVNAVPEPASLGLMAIGLLALARRRRGAK